MDFGSCEDIDALLADSGSEYEPSCEDLSGSDLSDFDGNKDVRQYRGTKSNLIYLACFFSI